jgi:NAD-dependent SIR2 family protein deacetylase
MRLQKRRLYVAAGITLVAVGGAVTWYLMQNPVVEEESLPLEMSTIRKLQQKITRNIDNLDTTLNIREYSLVKLCVTVYSTCFVIIMCKLLISILIEKNGTYENLDIIASKLYDNYFEKYVQQMITEIARKSIPKQKPNEKLRDSIWQMRSNFENLFSFPSFTTDQEIFIEFQQVIDSPNFQLAFTECSNVLFDLFYQKNSALHKMSSNETSYKLLSDISPQVLNDVSYINTCDHLERIKYMCLS